MISFTLREIQGAWRKHYEACIQKNDQTHFLLLFYSVECGLKAILLKRRGLSHTDHQEVKNILKKNTHNINFFLDSLYAGKHLNLPTNVEMTGILHQGKRQFPRRVSPGKLNEMWRYGGQTKNNAEPQLKQKLMDIHRWICNELQTNI